jgi:hypothetical protein
LHFFSIWWFAADKHGTADILTLDERHFRAMRTRNGQAFRLLPADL